MRFFVTGEINQSFLGLRDLIGGLIFQTVFLTRERSQWRIQSERLIICFFAQCGRVGSINFEASFSRLIVAERGVFKVLVRE